MVILLLSLALVEVVEVVVLPLLLCLLVVMVPLWKDLMDLDLISTVVVNHSSYPGFQHNWTDDWYRMIPTDGRSRVVAVAVAVAATTTTTRESPIFW